MSDAGVEGLRKLFAPTDSAEKAAAASGAELLAVYTKNSLAVPGVEAIWRRCCAALR